MVHRLALVVGAFVATTILAYAATTARPPAAADPAAGVVAEPVAAGQPAPTVIRTVTDTIYVAPVPEQAVVHVTNEAPPVDVVPALNATPVPQARSTERELDDGDEAEGEGDDD